LASESAATIELFGSVTAAAPAPLADRVEGPGELLENEHAQAATATVVSARSEKGGARTATEHS
jgi:hypothetical protein